MELIVNTETLAVTKSGNTFTAYLNGATNVHNSTLGLAAKYRPAHITRTVMIEDDAGHPVVAYFDAAKMFIAYDRVTKNFVPASDRVYGQITWMI